MIVRSHTFSSSATWTIPSGTEAFDTASVAPPSASGQSIEANYALQAALGASGTQTATASSNADTGVADTLALRPATGAYFGFGMTDGTTSRSLSASSQNGGATSNAASRLANKVLTITQWGTPGVVIAEADFTSWDSTNLTLNWTTNDASSYVVHYIAVGGTDRLGEGRPVDHGPRGGRPKSDRCSLPAERRASRLRELSRRAAASPVVTAGAAFGLGAMDGDGNQWANAFFSVDGSAAADTQRGQQIDAVIYAFDAALTSQRRAHFVSMNSDGFTVNFSPTGSAVDAQVISLALAGLNAQVGNFDKVAAPTTVQVVPGVNFLPAAVLLTSFQDVARTAGPVAHSRFGIGASDGTTEGSSAFQDQDAVTPTNMIAIDKTSKAFIKIEQHDARRHHRRRGRPRRAWTPTASR